MFGSSTVDGLRCCVAGGCLALHVCVQLLWPLYLGSNMFWLGCVRFWGVVFSFGDFFAEVFSRKVIVFPGGVNACR